MSVALLLSLSCWVVLQDAEASSNPGRALIERAVQAQGGLEALSTPRASRSKIKGAFFGSTKFSGDFCSGGAGKIRLTMRFEEDGERLIIMNGGKGWTQFNGVMQEMDEAAIERTQKARYVDRVCGLVTLLRDKGYSFTVLPEIQVDNRPAVGVKVSSEGKADVNLYFDKGSGLLAKSTFRQVQIDGREATMEAFYRDYELVNNSAEAEKILRDAGRGVETALLLKYLQENTPTAADREQIQKLIVRLGDPLFARREQASGGLVRFGIKAGAFLQQAKRSSDVEVARRAAKCLEMIAPECELAAAAVRLLNVRRTASAEVLLGYLPFAPDEQVASEVSDGLAAIIRKQTKVDAIWQKASAHEDPRIRQIAAAALGKDGGVFLQQPGQRLFIEGLRLPRNSSTLVDGQQRMDMETSERAFYNGLDDTLFEPVVNP